MQTGADKPFIKPWEDKELGEKLQKAADAGATIVGMDLDAAGLFTLRLMGGPFSVAAVGGLKQGVTQYLEQLRSELIQAMILTGCPDVSKVDREILC